VWDLSNALSPVSNHSEAGIDLNCIADRMAIRNAIQKGDIQEAISRVNDLNPKVLDFVYFRENIMLQ
jgi:hypothetical protein